MTRRRRSGSRSSITGSCSWAMPRRTRSNSSWVREALTRRPWRRGGCWRSRRCCSGRHQADRPARPRPRVLRRSRTRHRRRSSCSGLCGTTPATASDARARQDSSRHDAPTPVPLPCLAPHRIVEPSSPTCLAATPVSGKDGSADTECRSPTMSGVANRLGCAVASARQARAQPDLLVGHGRTLEPDVDVAWSVVPRKGSEVQT